MLSKISVDFENSNMCLHTPFATQRSTAIFGFRMFMMVPTPKSLGFCPAPGTPFTHRLAISFAHTWASLFRSLLHARESTWYVSRTLLIASSQSSALPATFLRFCTQTVPPGVHLWVADDSLLQHLFLHSELREQSSHAPFNGAANLLFAPVTRPRDTKTRPRGE